MKNLIIYKSHWEMLDKLSVEQVGVLFKGIAKYSNGEEVFFADEMLKGIWIWLERDFSIQDENYQKKKEANRKNGKLGGRPKTKDNPNNPMGFNETQHNPQNLKDKDIDIDIDIEKEKDRDIVLRTTKEVLVKNSPIEKLWLRK